MSEQRPVDAGDTLKVPSTRSEKKARLAAVLSRGVTTMNLDTSFLPADTYGQWARNEPNDIARLQSLGFEVYNGKHPNPIHSKADGNVVVGDVILMTTSKENKELIDEVFREQVEAKHNPKKPQEEENQFSQNVKAHFGNAQGLSTFASSRVEEVDANQIIAATKEE